MITSRAVTAALLCAAGPLPGYAADTAGPQLRHVPILRVSHIEEEGEADNHVQACAWVFTHQGIVRVSRVCTQDTRFCIRGEVDVVYPEPVGVPHTAYPSLPAGQVPPEDDDDFSEYPVYSVEDYQDPELPWDSDGEIKGLDQRGSGSADRAHPTADLL